MKTLTIPFILISMAVFSGCNNHGDHFAGVDFGKDNANNFIKTEIANKNFLIPSDDLTSFTYFIKDDMEYFPVEVTVNPDGYNFGKVRQLKIGLGGDTVYYRSMNSQYQRAYGPRLKSDVDKIYNLYEEWYGKPNSINIKTRVRSELEKYFSGDTSSTTIDTVILSKTAYWYNDNYRITFYLPTPVKNPLLNSEYTYSNETTIVYEMINYNKTIQAIRDSIIKTLEPNDIISINVNNPEWSILSHNYYGDNTQLTISIDEITRYDREIRQSVTAIRFDIILLDQFGEELYRLKDLTFEPKKRVYNIHDGVIIHDNFYIHNTSTITAKYNRLYDNSTEIEKARRYSSHHTIKATADIKAIVFENGAVIK
jgi:hypothetical protein